MFFKSAFILKRKPWPVSIVIFQNRKDKKKPDMLQLSDIIIKKNNEYNKQPF